MWGLPSQPESAAPAGRLDPAGRAREHVRNGVIGPFLIIYLKQTFAGSPRRGRVIVATGAGGLRLGFCRRLRCRSDGTSSRAQRCPRGAAVALLCSHDSRDWHAFALNLIVGVATGSFWPSNPHCSAR